MLVPFSIKKEPHTMFSASNLLNDFAHLFFPHICSGCGTDIINKETPLCLQCIHDLPVTNFHSYAGNPVEKIFWGRLPLVAASACHYFTKDSLLQHLLHQLKYRGNKEIGIFLGNMMGQALKQSPRFSDVEALVPLPLFASREKKRGYNQATIICEGIAEAMQVPVLNQAIMRLSATETQTQKNRIERWQNMEGRFFIKNAAAIANKHILLVDDVVTTGATLEACGQKLLTVKNSQLSIATLAFVVK
jgi:ComF family protein